MKILGIETSCDEIASSVVENGTVVLSNEIESSLTLHKETKGIVPEIAAREAGKKILKVIDNALHKANCFWCDIQAIAVTVGPGLAGSLLTGIETARTLAFIHKKPLIPVHHIMGHIFSNLLNRKLKINFPSIILTVSGGHSNLVLWSDFLQFSMIGETLDDAAGEAFDKVATMLGLPFPGGVEIARLAEKGDENKFNFPLAMKKSANFNFSFSGLKTAVLYKKIALEKNKKLTFKQKCDLAASFQKAAIDALTLKLFKAVNNFKIKSIFLAGGVSANVKLKEAISLFAKNKNLSFYHPLKNEFCTDNAAMIACCGYFIFKNFPKQYSWEKVGLNLDFAFWKEFMIKK